MAKTIDIGAVGEHRFAAEVLARGSLANWPSSQMHPYDLLVDTGKHCYRVQVKSSEKKSDKIAFQFRMISGRGRRRYTKNDADFIVLYLIHFETYYIFPVEAVGTGVTVSPANSKCKYAKYANAWHLLSK
jgi:hypothetical protein